MTEQQPLPVAIYVNPMCRYSLRIRNRLQDWQIPITEHNILQDDDAASRLERLTGGYRSTPTLVFGDEVTAGKTTVLVEPTVPELKAALHEAGYDVE